MELVKIDTTKAFGAPRTASFYALTEEERGLIEAIETEKKRVKDSEPRYPKGGAWTNKFKQLQEPLNRLHPFVNYFIMSMPDADRFFQRYGIETNFGEGFQISLNDVSISPEETTLTVPSEEQHLLIVRPHFHIKYAEPINLLECWSCIGLVSDDDSKRLYHHFGILTDALKVMYANSDGIDRPKVEHLNISAARHIPRVLADMRELESRLAGLNLTKAIEIRKELVYHQTHEFTGKPIIRDALQEVYDRMLDNLVNPKRTSN